MRLRRNPISNSMVTSSAEPSPLEILPWLKTLPLAPEYHPTVAEFQDPIAYILKIEKEASTYGICKIVPPVPAPPRKTAIVNLNRSFSARNGGGSKKVAATFSSRQQQIGFCPRKSRPAQKPVWQSGEQYTLQEFEAKAKQFEKSQLKRCGRKGNNGAFSPLEVETLFWKASADKPIMVEYANDMPGSGFAPVLLNNGSKKWREEDTCNVGDTAWNMRGVSRAKGSLLKFMKEEIPGVTSPMVYVGMMFSWFAWHVEDHELHSLNYMHIGAGKTWYGMPRDAALAFEEVVRVHGYGGEVNPLVTFAILGEKTTVMSPEVLVGAGIPCCRLVQNAGDFVVTFPGSYHCGFSHGFNCGEAANIATPEWLKVAKEAAIRRASINYPPMVSHFQLLYELTLSLSSRIPLNYVTEPRSSRLKDKMKGEGEIIVKEHFVENISRNNNLLHTLLGVGASCVVLPQNALESSSYTDAYSLSRIKFKPRLTLDFRSQNEVLKESSDSLSEDTMLESNVLHKRRKSSCNKGNQVSVCQGNSRLIKCNKVQTVDLDPMPNIEKTDSIKESSHYNEGLLNQGLLSCVACGILSFACVAIIQPTDAAALHLMSADCSSFDKNSFRPRFDSGKASTCELTPDSGLKHVDGLDLSYYGRTQVSSRLVDLLPESVAQKCPSALDLLASAYRNSDSEEDIQDEELACNEDEPSLSRINMEKEEAMSFNDPSSGYFSTTYKDTSGISSNFHETAANSNSIEPNKTTNDEEKNEYGKLEGCAGVPLPGGIALDELNSGSLITGTADFYQKDRKKESQQFDSSGVLVLPDACKPDASTGGNAVVMVQDDKLGSSFLNSSRGFMHSQDRDSSRMHVFCLEHAYEVEKQLRMMGGAHMMVLCHPGYPHLEAEAKLVAEELGSDYVWKDIHFKDGSEEDHKRIKSALEDEEVVPSNSDWAVKMHVNLYYSSNLSKSPLYSKQLPYNAVIYKAFGRNSSGGSPKALKVFHRRRGRQKKVVVAGRWCGKVWMSNQVHPYLACKNETEEEHSEVFQLELADQETVEGDIDNSDQGTQNRSSFDNSNTTEKVSTGGKRKKTLSKSKAKKVKYDKPEKSTEVSPESSSRKAGRILRERANRPSTLHNDDDMIGCSKLSSDDDSKEMPSTRPRRKPMKSDTLKRKKVNLEKQMKKKGKEASTKNTEAADEGFEYLCDVEGCTMSFPTKQELSLHKRNICPVKGCGKKFFSHKYLVQHRRVHMDDRPLKCPWKGCKMSFKWAWARTEHIRVHTGDRPYICMERGCGQTFRFVSDFSRHKRKTGHVSKKGRR